MSIHPDCIKKRCGKVVVLGNWPTKGQSEVILMSLHFCPLLSPHWKPLLCSLLSLHLSPQQQHQCLTPYRPDRHLNICSRAFFPSIFCNALKTILGHNFLHRYAGCITIISAFVCIGEIQYFSIIKQQRLTCVWEGNIF